MKPELRYLLARFAAATLFGATACSVTAWAVTAHELNTLTAYQPVGALALRALKEKDDAAMRVRLARSRIRDRDRTDEGDHVFTRRVMPAVYDMP